MKTGIELISDERQEQINKHGWSLTHDTNHTDGELIYAAEYALNPHPKIQKGIKCYHGWDWFTDKIDAKSDLIERYKIAGALIAAEIDRLQKLKQ